MEDDDVSNVFCAADAFMAIFGLRRSNGNLMDSFPRLQERL